MVAQKRISSLLRMSCHGAVRRRASPAGALAAAGRTAREARLAAAGLWQGKGTAVAATPVGGTLESLCQSDFEDQWKLGSIASARQDDLLAFGAPPPDVRDMAFGNDAHVEQVGPPHHRLSCPGPMAAHEKGEPWPSLPVLSLWLSYESRHVRPSLLKQK
ncbi:hypothetical protein [Streptomyces sp. NPDC004658]|uniref:hypothetical protein n=1 Tax=Streptomyces sp. NPDC004658 TaxID=3154672 RepID=UPI0033A054E3